MEKFASFTYEDIVRMTRGFQSEIGNGTTAIVYEGQHVHNRKVVAVAVKKIIIPTGVKSNTWEKEKTMLAHFSGHKNIIKCFGVGETSETEKAGFLVLEYLPYTLADAINEKIEIGWIDFLSIMEQIAGALFYIHTHKSRDNDDTYVFVDVKPENIMFNKDNEGCIAKLIDLGSVVKSGTMAGFYTKECAAPELTKKGLRTQKCSITSKIDVYGFGDIMFKVISMDNRLVTEDDQGRKGRGKTVSVKHKDVRGLVSRYMGYMWDLKEPQMKAISKLVEDCRMDAPQRRPNMDEVLRRLGELKDERT